MITAIIAAGGRGERVGGHMPKQLLPLGGRPMLSSSVETFLRHPRIDAVVVVLPLDVHFELTPEFERIFNKPLTTVVGGPRRQDSVAAGFAAADERSEIVVIHDAARPLIEPVLIDRAIDAAAEAGAAICALPAQDTIKVARWERDGDAERAWVDRTLSRDAIFLAQTPQAFRRGVLAHAIRLGQSQAQATDEAFLAEQAGYRVRLVEGSPRNMKVTTAKDLELAQLLAADSAKAGVRTDNPPEGRSDNPPEGGSHIVEQPGMHSAWDPASAGLRVGLGYDIHRLVEGRRLVLGGVQVPFERGLLGHSDADVLCHAITDAVLGAAGAGDIGRHFPDTDDRWRDASSIDLLRQAVCLVRDLGFAVVNVDAVLMAERPKVANHVPEITQRLAGALQIRSASISVKGKTNEGLGEIGRGEAIACQAVALLRRLG